MTITRATVSLDTLSGLPRDRITNVWHFASDGRPPMLQGPLLVASLFDFYKGLNVYYSQAVRRGTDAHTITLAEVSPGVGGADDDVVSEVWFQGSSGVAWTNALLIESLPAEVACCLSFSGNLAGIAEESGSTRPRSRRRGRVYLGPFTTGVLRATTDNKPGMFTPALQNSILDKYQILIGEINSPGDGTIINHVIYSPTSGNATKITTAWVNDEPDTIRSRGRKATMQTTRDIDQLDWAVIIP